MPNTAKMREDRRLTNPAFNQRKLKLGTFQSNLDYGCLMSDVEGRLKISWPNTRALAKLADEMEFEALLPVARWRGFGGKLNPQGLGFETFTWASGIAASTDKTGVIATTHCSINHPLMAAKQSTVIDHISGGRFILNIVTGWNKPEIDMFGVEMLPHDERYDMAEEWLSHRQTAVDRRRRIRPRGQVLQDRQRLSAAEADPAAVSAGDECRRLRARPPFRRQVLRHGVHRARRAGLRAEQGASRGLPQARARGIWPRSRDLDVGQHHSSGNRGRGAALQRLRRARKGRLGSGDDAPSIRSDSMPRPFRPRP